MLCCYERIILLCGNPRDASNSRHWNYVCSTQSHEQRENTPQRWSRCFNPHVWKWHMNTCKVYVHTEVKDYRWFDSNKTKPASRLKRVGLRTNWLSEKFNPSPLCAKVIRHLWDFKTQKPAGSETTDEIWYHLICFGCAKSTSFSFEVLWKEIFTKLQTLSQVALKIKETLGFWMMMQSRVTVRTAAF